MYLNSLEKKQQFIIRSIVPLIQNIDDNAKSFFYFPKHGIFPLRLLTSHRIKGIRNSAVFSHPAQTLLRLLS